MAVNLSVIGCYFVQRRERNLAGFWKYLVSPLIGFLVCFWIWLSVSPLALRVGVLWSFIGVLYLFLLIRRRGVNLAGYSMLRRSILLAEVPNAAEAVP